MVGCANNERSAISKCGRSKTPLGQDIHEINYDSYTLWADQKCEQLFLTAILVGLADRCVKSEVVRGLNEASPVLMLGFRCCSMIQRVLCLRHSDPTRAIGTALGTVGQFLITTEVSEQLLD